MSNKIKYELEFTVKSSANLLYKYIATPSGLSEWFADNVNSRGEIFTFIWDGEEEQAKLLTKKLNQFVKFKWADDEETERKIDAAAEAQIDLAKEALRKSVTAKIRASKILTEVEKTGVDDLHGLITKAKQEAEEAVQGPKLIRQFWFFCDLKYVY